MPRLWLSALLIQLLGASLAFAVDNEPVNTLPAVTPNASSYSNTRNFLNTEDASRCDEQGLDDFVVSGGTHATSINYTSPSFATIAYTNSCQRVNQASASINYQTQGAAASDTCWVIASAISADTTGNYTRVSGTDYFVNCVDTSQPSTPSNSTNLMKVTISGGAITVVTDLRRLAAGRGLPLVDCGTFGVIGDDATDNTTALQNCLNASGSQAGTRFLPRGTYRVRDQITIPNNVCLVGEGWGRTIIKLDPAHTMSADESVFPLSGADNVCFQDFTLDVNYPNATGSGVSGIGGTFSNSRIEHVEVKNTIGNNNGGSGIHCNPPCANNRIRFNWVHNIGHPDTSTLVLTDTAVTVVEGASSISGFSGLTVNAHTDRFVQVTGNGITPTTYRIYSNTADTLDLGGQNLDFASNTYAASIYTTMAIGDCIFLKGFDNDVSHNRLEYCADGNTISGSNEAIELSPHGNVVIGNTVQHTTSDGCWTLGPGSVGIVSGNILRNCGQNCFTAEALGSLSFSGAQIVDNQCSAAGRDGITNTLTNVLIQGNQFFRVGRRCIDDFAQNNRIIGNTCYNAGEHGILLEGGSAIVTDASTDATQGSAVITGFTGLTVNALAQYWSFTSIPGNVEAHRILSNTATTITLQEVFQGATGTYTTSIYSTNAGTVIKDNTIVNPGFNNVAITTSGIHTLGAQADIHITGNTIYHNSSSGKATQGIRINDVPIWQVTISPTNHASGGALTNAVSINTSASSPVRVYSTLPQAQQTLNFGAPGAVPGCSTQSFFLQGATLGNRVDVGPPVNVDANQFYKPTAWVSAASTIVVAWCQHSGAAADPDGSGGVYTIEVSK